MSELLADLAYTMRLTTPELRLVLKALGGRLKNEDFEPAAQLGNAMTKQRADALRPINKVVADLDKVLSHG